ncbi:Uma2 family endonuclease [Aggregicoccus sp. 17bor-14]|nr:Uma2 family endonuclease [Simulacricoccus sp. 17bor-14]MRI91123.1 Uma2 family endonuclease [Aggregicoccus sp. 17bor-14]
MCAKPARPPATYADLEDLPTGWVGEIVGGELVASPRPAIPHALVATRLAGLLDGAFSRGRSGPGGWLVLCEPELRLGGEVLVPDLAAWRRERLPASLDVAAMSVAPDWLCEVLSPSTAAHDRAVKLPAYAREDVGHVWLVDPALRTLELLRLDGAHYTLLATHHGEAAVHAEPYEPLALELRLLWEA